MATDPAASPTPASTPATPSAGPTPGAAPPPPPKPNRTQVAFWESFLLGRTKPGEYPVYHHSGLFYWWPVWFLGFLFALLTWMGNLHMAVVPEGSVAVDGRTVAIDEHGTFEERSVIILPKDRPHVRLPAPDGKTEAFQPKIYMARAKGMGTLFVVVLLLVVVITNISMRGLWSVFVLVVLVALAVIFAVAGWWDVILARVGQLAIYINLGGYLTIATVLFVAWFINFFFFDRQTFMIFTPGQVRVRLEIGEGEIVYDTTGMVFQKQRGDLFRHWILGFGSGDLLVRPAGQGGQVIEMPNVLRVGHVVKMIEQMVKERVIVTQPSPNDPR